MVAWGLLRSSLENVCFLTPVRDPFLSDFATQMEPKMEPKSTKNRSRKQPNYHTTKKNEKTAKINTFLSPLSYKSVQTVKAKRLFSHFHLSCNKVAQETEKRSKIDPKWSQNGAKMGSKASQNGVQKYIKKMVAKSVEVGPKMVPFWEPSLVKKSLKRGSTKRSEKG